MKNFLVLLFPCLLLALFRTPVFAQSSYVLPYPSNMPGSIYYKLDLFKEVVMRYWYFGDFGQFNYNLKYADKYLVEAKILFEYRQYLLGINALEKSDRYFQNINPSLEQAKAHGKNINKKKEVLKEASAKHMETLMLILNDAPEVFDWKPEKELPTKLEIKKTILESVSLRASSA